MGRGRTGSGVELREKSIRVAFTYNGERCRETLDLEPTPPNAKYAARLVAEIKRKIGAGTFRYADYFPKSVKHAPTGTTIEKLGELWLSAKGRLAGATKSQYSNALKFWYGQLGKDADPRNVTHGKLAALVGSHPWASPKLCNNYMIPLRGLFALAVRDMGIPDPTEGIANARIQRKAPDPFTIEEMAAILNALQERYDARVWAYYAFAFAAGMRPEEIIALKWGDIDGENIRVERAKSFRGQVKPIKTYQVRDVELTVSALAAIAAMKPFTFLKSEYIFENPVTGKPWHDERSQRDHYWMPTLKRLGMRQRPAYQTRHTFITIALMAGANPAYIARQAGHRSAQMVFNVYGKWIDRADRGREKDKIEAALSSILSLNCPQDQDCLGRRDWIRTNPKGGV